MIREKEFRDMMVRGLRENRLRELYLYLVKCAITKTNPDEKLKDVLRAMDWRAFFLIARSNKVASLVYPVVKYCVENFGVDDQEMYEGWIGFLRMSMFSEIQKNIQVAKVKNEAEKEGLTFVFFKGLLLADLYPQFSERPGCDTDIFVYEEDREPAEKLFQRMGYVKDEEDSKEQVQVYRLRGPVQHMIELHTRLWEDYKGRRIDILDSMNLTARNSLIRTKACGLEVTTLGYEEHLVFQLFHIIKHFSLEGVGIRYLVDITLFVNKYLDKINKKTFWEKIDRLGYHRFATCFFTICEKHLGMRGDIFPDKREIIDENLDEFLEDMFSVGDGMDRDAKWQILGAMEAYFLGEAKVEGSKFKRKIEMIFPNRDSMPYTYSYARKYPVLLPVAWVHRGYKFIINYFVHKKNYYNPAEKVNVAEKRMYMVKLLGLDEIKDRS